MNAILEAAVAKRDAAQTQLDALIATAGTRDIQAFTEDEATEFEALAAEIRALEPQITGLREQEARSEKAAAAAAELERNAASAIVGREPVTYGEEQTWISGSENYRSYFRDLATLSINGFRDYDMGHARERLDRHAKEMDVETRKLDETQRRQFAAFLGRENGGYEQRVNPNTTAGTGGEFVPPLWLVSLYAPYARPGRVLANRVPSHPLPPGIDVINLPQITTGALTAVQSANAVPVASRDIVTATVSANVNTIAGQEDISMQLLEQSPISMDGVIFDDLSRDYDQRLDVQVISGSGSATGQHLGVLSLTQASANSTTAFNTDRTKANQVTCASVLFWDGTTATSFTQYRSIVNAVTNIEILRFAAPTAIWAHPRRVNSWSLASDSTIGRPLFTQYAAFNNLGRQESSPVTEGQAGELYGLPVFKDANVPTVCATGAITGGTGDVVAVLKEDDLILWEGTMRMRALPEILSGTLQIRFQVYAYSAFMPGRFPASVSIITGSTGLAAPSW